ncbi:MAG: iron-sulfur cluster carrier protein ApbC [Methylophilales bacterium]|nr:iron-sulfur cluster carrier protein ApbC [Methylophilales bacterium]
MEDIIKEILLNLTHVNYEESFIKERNVRSISVQKDKVEISIELNFPIVLLENEFKALIANEIEMLIKIPVQIYLTQKIKSHQAQKGISLIKGVKNVIAVASGKGGVGKSSTAVNLALALMNEGSRVGILDADIYGPSQPQMLGINQKPESKDGKSMEPLIAHGLQVMSVGFLVDQETPMIWRGPMVTNTLEQLLKETNWDNLDYLVIDLPPGTGDIHLTLAQKIPVTGAIIVTTPQDIALLDARRGLKMFEKVNVPIIGIVENMSTHICTNCGHEEHIFGHGGGNKMSIDYNTLLLGNLPLDISIREQLDNGNPSVAADPTSKISKIYQTIAQKVAYKVSELAEDHSGKFPNIVIQNS